MLAPLSLYKHVLFSWIFRFNSETHALSPVEELYDDVEEFSAIGGDKLARISE